MALSGELWQYQCDAEWYECLLPSGACMPLLLTSLFLPAPRRSSPRATYEPLGATEPVRADVRIIAATNRVLLHEVRTRRFREDLYYRLNVLRITLPPLRERRCDVPLLVDYFRRRLNAETGKNIEDVEGAVLDSVMRYEFPGNVRELENLMQHAFVLCRESVIRQSHLPRELAAALASSEPMTTPTLEDIEKKAIETALANQGGNRTAAAKQLAIDPSTLYRKMRRYGIRGR